MSLIQENKKRKSFREDLTGKKFNELTVISFLPYHDQSGMWLCVCECGGRKAVRASNLKDGVVKSCGCLLKGRRPGEVLTIPSELSNLHSEVVENGLFRVFENGMIFKLTEYGPVEAVQSNGNGYNIVSTTVNGKQKHFYVHRLMCMAFLPNPENKTQVNHLDGDKTNNSLENLEWVTAKENVIHAYQTGLANQQSNSKPCINCGEPTLARDEMCSVCKQEKMKEIRKNKTLAAIKESVAYMDPELLTDRQNEAVALRKQGEKIAEIGRKLGMSRQGAESLLRNAERRIENKKILSKAEIKELEVLIKRKLRKEDKKKKLLLEIQKIDIDIERTSESIVLYEEKIKGDDPEE